LRGDIRIGEKAPLLILIPLVRWERGQFPEPADEGEDATSRHAGREVEQDGVFHPLDLALPVKEGDHMERHGVRHSRS